MEMRDGGSGSLARGGIFSANYKSRNRPSSEIICYLCSKNVVDTKSRQWIDSPVLLQPSFFLQNQNYTNRAVFAIVNCRYITYRGNRAKFLLQFVENYNFISSFVV